MKKNDLWKLTLMALPLLVSCGGGGSSASSSSGGEYTTLTDLSGRSVSLDLSKIKKIVCIGAGALRLYSYVNGAEMLGGVEDIDNPARNSVLNSQFSSSPRPYYMVYGNSYKTLPSIGKGGPSNQAAEKELLAASASDLVLSEYEDVKAADDLREALGIPVLTLKYDTKNLFGDALYSSLNLIGQVTGKETRAKELVEYIKGEVSNISSLTKDIDEASKKSVYLGCLGNWGVQDIFMTAKGYPLFEAAHIKNAADGVLSTNGFQKIDEEAFFTLDPDIIILDASGISKFKTTYNGSLKSSFDSLKAFQNGEVYLQMPYNNYYTNIETALMDCYYDASVVFPGSFSNFDIKAKSNEISTKFLGMNLYDEMSALPNSYGGFQKINVSTFLAL